ncbi:MAG: anti-sigma regulatory factor [Candidatus Stahlbacteria bacterium]|nr:MAG: anti-sigma regulatory factor [Candidatus Stahlbacteria bacterium]
MIVVPIKEESDIVHARAAAKDVARKLGFGLVDQTRISTAVSELARNIYLYAGEGEVHIEEHPDSHRGIRVTFIDNGPGIDDVELALKDGWSSTKAMGKGLPGAKRLTDHMEINTQPGHGTTVTIEKWLAQ